MIYSSNNGNLQIESTDFTGGRINLAQTGSAASGTNNTGSTLTQDIHYFHTDHLGSVRAITDNSGSVIEQNAYYPFGSRHTFGNTYAQTTNRFKFNGKEEQTTGNLNYLDYGARMYDSNIARWTTQDPLAEKYYAQSPYNYCVNNPVNIIDPYGKDTVMVLDNIVRPIDNGCEETYTAILIVIQNGIVVGSYRGSSYPNSISITDNRTKHNTLNDGEYDFNNKYGHYGEKTGFQKALNIVDADGKRIAPGTKPDGSDVTMTHVNVHSGYSDNKGPKSRGSRGCITIHPDDAESFFAHFNWNKNNECTGNSYGKIILKRDRKKKK